MRVGSNGGFSNTKARAIRQSRLKAKSKLKSNEGSSTKTASGSKSSSAAKTGAAGKTGAAQMKKIYTSIKDGADSIKKRADKLMDTGADSLFGAAVKGEAAEKDELIKEVRSFIQDYNSMIDGMTDSGDLINNIFLKQTDSCVAESKMALKELGITVKKDRTLSVNQQTLGTADIEKLYRVFGREGGFAEKVSSISEKVESNASTNLNSLNKSSSSNYNRYGRLTGNNGSSGGMFSLKG